MTTQSPVASFAAARRAQRAIGAMFFTVFGGAWIALWAASAFAYPAPALAVAALLTVGLLWRVIGVFRRYRPDLQAQPDSPQAKRKSRIFNLINGAQWIVIIVLGNVLVRTGHGELVIPMALFVIGLHFLPLARLFGYRPHYVTGAALIVVALLGPVLQMFMDLLAGLILWTSAAWAMSGRGEGV